MAVFQTYIFHKSSVARSLRCGWTAEYNFITNLLVSLTVKFFLNRLTFGAIRDRSIVSCFLTHSVVYLLLLNAISEYTIST